MEKFTNFILKKRNLIFSLLAIFAGISIYLATFVTVNTDMTEYLPQDSNVRAGLEVMEQEFGEVNAAELHVMFEDLEEANMQAIYSKLSELSGVSQVTFDINSTAHVSDEFTLYTLTLESRLTNDEEYALVQNILDTFNDFNLQLSGNVYGVAPLLNMMLIIIPTVVILILIFFVMCRSWFEPIIFFINIGIAILINMGTNVVFGSISEASDMMAGVLQVALSMDYAIIFLNRYRREKELLGVEATPNHQLVMKKTILNSFSPISGIAFTTIIGMLMLVFMSFTIGADMGLVIAKSVFISLICVFGVMPALILRFEKLIERTKKPALNLKMNGIGHFSYNMRYLIGAFFTLLFVGAFMIQNNNEIIYSEIDFDPVHQTFDLDNPFVLLYENVDETEMGVVIAYLAEQENIIDIYAYGTTLGQHLTESAMATALELDELLTGLVFRNYLEQAPSALSLGEFLQFLQDEVTDLPMISEVISTDDLSQLATVSAMFELEMMEQLFPPTELAELLQLDIQIINQLLYLHDFIHGEALLDTMTPVQFIDYLLTEFAQIPLFEPLFTVEVLTTLEEASLEITEASTMFVSASFSRVIINTTFEFESETTFAFIDDLTETLNQQLTGDFYLLGESVMPHELNQTFPREHRIISTLTTFAFFIVAAISFKSISVSIVLAIVIQASVFIAMGVNYFLDINLHFLDIIIVQAILKSRVIDYGILYIANYIEARQNHDIKQAIKAALNHSIDTILTSGLIIILVTFVSGIVFMGVNVSIAQILFLIAQGCLIGILLSIFILPALIAIFDRFIIKATA